MANEDPAVAAANATAAAASAAASGIVNGSEVESSEDEAVFTFGPTKRVTGGYKLDVDVLEVAGVLMEKYTAYDFYLMQLAAAMDGIKLVPIRCFASFEQQEKIFLSRVMPNTRTLRAGMPPTVDPRERTSNHQRGIAVDIGMGVSDPGVAVEAYKRGDRSASGQQTGVYLWLEANAANFGFSHEEGHLIGEAWHWNHLKQEVSGRLAGVKIAVQGWADIQLSNRARDVNNPAALRWSYRQFHYNSRARMRSASAQEADVEKMVALALADQLVKKGRALGRASYHQQMMTAASTPRPSFSADADANAYDFTTGLWGDGRTT